MYNLRLFCWVTKIEKKDFEPLLVIVLSKLEKGAISKSPVYLTTLYLILFWYKHIWL